MCSGIAEQFSLCKSGSKREPYVRSLSTAYVQETTPLRFQGTAHTLTLQASPSPDTFLDGATGQLRAFDDKTEMWYVWPDDGGQADATARIIREIYLSQTYQQNFKRLEHDDLVTRPGKIDTRRFPSQEIPRVPRKLPTCTLFRHDVRQQAPTHSKKLRQLSRLGANNGSRGTRLHGRLCPTTRH